ncbi:WbqC family protein [Olivibacter sp. SDN3]|uniref:WbqC family protein n=1 Tax=Olivibacter sp. SDN3 TaxID=2764720 RepID=UPI001651886F|nr:WbqC family protein [Olivibacter sp. SDN3]QNL48444.1 WbqC family protein [Olivibacter sp. SDN3]
MEKNNLFPCLYLPPIAAVSEMLKEPDKQILIEQFEHFPKQTYRNRAVIHSPNGKLNLIIPIVKGAKVHTIMKDVKISYESNWQRLHWMSIQTSYRRSAYFEFYEDEFIPFFEKKYDFLIDYDVALLSLILKLLKVNKTICYTNTYEKNYTKGIDLRESIHPKKKYPTYDVKPYFQVFEPKNGFIANLSIIDLLFNQGPNSLNYL